MTIQKLGLLSLALALSTFTACSSDNGTTPTASGVFPAQGFTGRSLRVEISGDATKWKDGATVSFGDGVTVNMVEVASPTDLFADISVDPAAMPGMRDVTVTSSGTFTLSQAFELVAPVELQFTGDVTQVALPAFKILNHDFDNPFDTTTGTDANGNTTYPNLTITAPMGVDFESPLISSAFVVSSFEIDGFATIDIDAASGPVSIASGPSASSVTSTTAAMTVTPRSAVGLTLGTAGTGMIANVGDSALFSLPAASGSPELARLQVATNDSNAQPELVLLGSSGHWSDFISAGAPYTVLQTSDALYAVVFDSGIFSGGGESNYSVQVTGYADQLTTAAQGTNTAIGTALTATAEPFEETDGDLGAGSSTYWVKFVVPASSPLIGKVFHVTTTLSLDPYTDLTVDVVESNGTTSISNGAQESDVLGCEFGEDICGVDLTTSAIPAAGTYYVKVGPGSDYDSGDSTYTLVFWVE